MEHVTRYCSVVLDVVLVCLNQAITIVRKRSKPASPHSNLSQQHHNSTGRMQHDLTRSKNALKWEMNKLYILLRYIRSSLYTLIGMGVRFVTGWAGRDIGDSWRYCPRTRQRQTPSLTSFRMTSRNALSFGTATAPLWLFWITQQTLFRNCSAFLLLGYRCDMFLLAQFLTSRTRVYTVKVERPYPRHTDLCKNQQTETCIRDCQAAMGHNG